MKRLISDPLLIERLKAKEIRAFEIIYDMCSPGVYGFLRYAVEDDEVASQLMGKTFEAAWTELDNLDAEMSVLNWLVRIARMKLEEWRNHNISPQIPLVDEGPKQKLDALSADLIKFIIYKGYNHQQLAEMFRISVEEAKGLVAAAVREMRVNLKRSNDNRTP